MSKTEDAIRLTKKIKRFENTFSCDLRDVVELLETLKKLKDFIKAFPDGIESIKFNKDFTVDVDGDVDLRTMGLSEIPLQFGKVTGSFRCDHNNLTSLDGAPEYVGESFVCSNNKLINLDYCPKSVGSFFCDHNNLTSLKGCPREVRGRFDCSYNNIKNLTDIPKRIVNSFDCSHNNLTSLIGGPEYVGFCFNCTHNNLTTLEGVPKEVGGNFDCKNNQLTTLRGFPENLDGGFGCENNPKLKSLKGIYKDFKGYIHSDFYDGILKYYNGEL